MSKLTLRKMDFLNDSHVYDFYLHTSEVPSSHTDALAVNGGKMLVTPVIGTPNKIMGYDGSNWATLAESNVRLAMDAGSTRPPNPVAGQMFLDTTLSPIRAIVWNVSAWVNMDGTSL
jgi:hypothetical protein